MTGAVARAERGKVRAFLSLVMIEHSIFALPFAYIAALTAMWQQTRSTHWAQLALITVAMVSARTVAMSANRILDRDFDALNPRTARRELITGELTVRSAWLGTGIALVVFLVSAALLSWLCLLLAPVAVAALVLYSYGKRFTDFPQALLALAQFVAPVGAWLAITGRVGAAPIALGLAVGTWIGGFDLIYSCQDAETDRRIGSRSFPARFGIPAALRWSAVVHAVTLAAFAWFGAAAGLGWLWWTGVALTGVVLAYEHVIVGPDDLSRVNRAFFTANGVIGIGLFAFALADLMAHGMNMVTAVTAVTAAGRVPWVVGVSGASGTPYARAVLTALLDAALPIDLIISRAARLTLLDETGLSFRDSHWHDDLTTWLEREVSGDVRYWTAGDLGAGPASGSYPARGMVVVPASTAAVAGIALGLSKDLLQRAAEVTLKEQRPLVVVPRETPYTRSTLQHMLALDDAGAVVLPASPGFYSAPKSVQQLVDFVAAKVLDVIGVEHNLITRWTGELGNAGR